MGQSRRDGNIPDNAALTFEEWSRRNKYDAGTRDYHKTVEDDPVMIILHGK